MELLFDGCLREKTTDVDFPLLFLRIILFHNKSIDGYQQFNQDEDNSRPGAALEMVRLIDRLFTIQD